ncbi:hypothetical protein [Pseudoxanthomonas winnipegensis]|nr:hypothetical protein [Pseudoxanthomonas winnipegensis]
MTIRSDIRTSRAEWAAAAVIFCSGAVVGAGVLLVYLLWGV